MTDKYISVTEFEKYLKKHIDEHNNCENLTYKELTDGYYDGVCACRAALLEFPTADVQPVKHGRWVYSDIPIFGNPYGRYCCSLCGSAMDSGTDNYCPCCGANMRGDVEIARIDK